MKEDIPAQTGTISSKRIDAKAVMLYAVFAFLVIFTISHKMAYFQDEILSYCLANNNEVEVTMNHLSKNTIGNETKMKVMQNYAYVPASSAFARLTSVPADGRFNFANVWKNQADDTHPPLFYLLLHIICSFFPGVFSKWFAGAINILFSLGILYAARKLVSQLTDNKFILAAVSLMLVFSSAILNSAACFRMYIMATFFVTLQTALFLQQTDKPVTGKFCLKIAAVTFFGTLTHYYCIFYIVLLSAIFGIQRLYDKDFKGTVCFSAAQFCGGLAACAVFPAVLTHIFHGARGTSEFMPNVMLMADYPQRLSAYWQVVSGDLFGKILPAFAAVSFIAVIYGNMQSKNNKHEKCEKAALPLQKYILASVPAICYFFIIAKLTPILTEGVFGDIKYMYPIFAVLLCIVSATAFILSDRFFSKNSAKCLTVILALSVIAGSWFCTDWNSRFLYREYQQQLFTQQFFSDSDCYCFYVNLIPKDVFYLSPYRSLTVMPLQEFNPKAVKAVLADERTNKLVICISRQNGINTDAVIAQLYPELNAYNISRTPLGRSEADEDGSIYHLQRAGY